MLRSFFLAGFESSTGYNVHRQWIDQVAATQHDRFVEQDYARLSEVGIRAVREAIRWPLVDCRGRYDFSTVRPFIKAARRYGIEIIYDLFHFGYPQDVDLFSPTFPERFADYCYGAARFVARHTPGACYFTPINEPSYFSWAAGEAGLFAPHATGRGWRLKVALARAAIRGIEAIRAACPAAHIINVDSLCRVVPPAEKLELQEKADAFNRSAVFQSWDLLSGRLLPELGGSPAHLGTLGINYYWTNQWEMGRAGMPLDDGDPRRWPLRRLIRGVWERYQRDILITETGHVGEMRPRWLRELAGEAQAMIEEGVPLRGICLYPILGMPEWHSRHEWTRMGLWDLEPEGEVLARVPYGPMFEALREAQRLESIYQALNPKPASLESYKRQKQDHVSGEYIADKCYARS